MLSVWDFYETILNSGDTPYRLHHGWIGFALEAIGVLALYLANRKALKLIGT